MSTICGNLPQLGTPATLQKLLGVTTQNVVPTGTSSLATLEITSTSPDITKESAILALGKQADAYQIQKLARQDSKR